MAVSAPTSAVATASSSPGVGENDAQLTLLAPSDAAHCRPARPSRAQHPLEVIHSGIDGSGQRCIRGLVVLGSIACAVLVYSRCYYGGSADTDDRQTGSGVAGDAAAETELGTLPSYLSSTVSEQGVALRGTAGGPKAGAGASAALAQKGVCRVRWSDCSKFAGLNTCER